jgi:two-component system, cell cycle response regulator
LANGDLSTTLGIARGPVLGSLKALQSALRHLTWQSQQVATGDFSQRVDFMGDFSRAFNAMVEELAKARTELEHRSTHDALTGLFNRAFFDAEVRRLTRGRTFPISFLAVDLDGLKRVNDTMGHAAGDHLIVRAATVLLSTFRAEDVVARLGGDEFTVLLPAVDATTGEKVLCRLAQRVEAANQDPGEPSVSMSVGLATASTGAAVPAALKLADERMYADKDARKAHGGCP